MRATVSAVIVAVLAWTLAISPRDVPAQVPPLIPIGDIQGQVLETDNGRTHASPRVGQRVRVRV